jgi:hypothetical protein
MAVRVTKQSAVLPVVHEDDLEKFLTSIGEWQEFQLGRRRCKFSDDVMTIHNLHAIFPESGAIKYACDKPSCVVALAEFAGTL